MVVHDKDLEIYSRLSQISYSELMKVYLDSNKQVGAKRFAHLDEVEQLIEAEQEFFAYIEFFLKEESSLYAVLLDQGHYLCCVRVEKYKDGVLLTGLETAPNERNKGYASELLLRLEDYLSSIGVYAIYSHVSSGNLPSIRVHEKCKYLKISDYAAYIDGSIDPKGFTLKKECRH